MSIYIDKMKDLLDANTAIAIQQLENDSAAGNLEATYLLGKVYFDGIYAAPTADRFIPLWEKGASNNIDCLRSLGDCYFFGSGYPESNEKAIEIYNEVIRRNPNDHQTLCQIGRMHGHGWGFTQNIPYSITLLEDAWRKGSGRAATEIGLLYMFNMEKTIDNIKAAVKWYQRGAEMGDSKGCYRMGLLYKWGDYGLPESPKTAYQYFVRGKELSDCLSMLITSTGCGVATPEEMRAFFAEAERRANWNDAELQDALGQAYARGLGVPANKELASTWYEKAIENGNTFSEYQYGMKYVLGTDGFEVDHRKGYEYLSHAAQAGQTYAMKPLAELLDDEYIPGLSTEERNSQMIYWFEKAVENGDEWAAVTLGRKYENGYSPVQVDVAKAIHYYQIAADHDIDMVYLSLGKLYMIPGPTANYKLAHRYLSLAQEKSTLDFQIGEIELCYGKMNKDGLGIPKNLEEAYRHFTIAASKGNTDAIEELKHIKKGLFGWKLI